MNNFGRCKSCGAEILWIGKKPCNPEPIKYDEAPVGTLLLTITGNFYKVDGRNSFPNVEGYESHFKTCPDADSWRGRRGPFS